MAKIILNSNTRGKNLLLKIHIFALLFLKKKISFKKILNALLNQTHYFLKSPRASAFPALLIVEPTNACNMHCLSCRDANGRIHDHYYTEKPGHIPLGFLNREDYLTALHEASPSLLMSVLYLQGEPLLHPEIVSLVQETSRKKVASMISTNATLLTPKLCEHLIQADLDIIKIPVSGFTDSCYSRHHKGGDIERIKRNLINLSELRTLYKKRLIIIVDYFLFDFNHTELASFKVFCKKHKLYFFVRKGDAPIQGPYKNIEVPLVSPSKTLCSWPWQILVLNWNGDFLPCNQFSKSSLPYVMKKEKNLRELWNGSPYSHFRTEHLKGRDFNFLCKRCDICGIGLRPREN